ncbi:MAG: hypothetical protein ACE5OW_00780 [Candidatus Bathyarchaeia archaeon]
MKSTPQVIRELKSKEEADVLGRTCCDILRTLTILHGSAWDSDLVTTLNEFWRMKRLREDQIGNLQGKIEGALKILNEKKIVVSQKRMRAELSKPHPTEETLHSAPDLITLLREFGGDRDVLRYRREIMGCY